MVGSTYQVSVPLLFQVALCNGVSYAIARQPGGASGVLLKSKVPNNCAYAESFGFNFDGRRRFRVMVAGSTNLSHRCRGKVGGSVARPERKWDLKVPIAFSAGFDLWS